jgi:SAM-dependent methyltransferase/uncharacterized protein YbaR (Trm112 family)
MNSRDRLRPAIHPYVQQMVAGTNGNTYLGVVNRLRSYPIPHLPGPRVSGGLFLDIGCGWGRWMVAAAQRGFVPVGIDIKLEAARASRYVLSEFGLPGFTVVADLRTLPFSSGIFDFVWSFSVIQHVHREWARLCVAEIARVLQPESECLLEFPTRSGLWNRHQVARWSGDDNDPSSWCVRYYHLEELRNLFLGTFGNFDYRVHCYFGTGIQSVDLFHVPWRYKPVILGSLALTQASRVFPLLRRIADSIYVSAQKRSESDGRGDSGVARRAPDQLNEAQFFAMLQCPASGDRLIFDEARNELVSDRAGLAYPIREGVPVLLPAEARRLGAGSLA